MSHHNPDSNKTVLLLGRLEGKVDAIIKALCKYDDKISTLDGRINHLERIQAYWAGAAALIATTIAFISHYIREAS